MKPGVASSGATGATAHRAGAKHREVKGVGKGNKGNGKGCNAGTWPGDRPDGQPTRADLLYRASELLQASSTRSHFGSSHFGSCRQPSFDRQRPLPAFSLAAAVRWGVGLGQSDSANSCPAYSLQRSSCARRSPPLGWRASLLFSRLGALLLVLGLVVLRVAAGRAGRDALLKTGAGAPADMGGGCIGAGGERELAELAASLDQSPTTLLCALLQQAMESHAHAPSPPHPSTRPARTARHRTAPRLQGPEAPNAAPTRGRVEARRPVSQPTQQSVAGCRARTEAGALARPLTPAHQPQSLM